MKRFLPILLIATLLVPSSCLWRRPQETPAPPGQEAFFTRVTYAQLPQPVKDWVTNGRAMHLGQELVFEGRRYIMASYGQKPSGGFAVGIEDVTPGDGIITVRVNHTRPAPGSQVTDAITFPRDVVFITNFQDPLQFVATGAEEHMPRLVGLRTLREITAESAGIKIFSPPPGEHVDRNIVVWGVANVFEGTVLWRLRDMGGSIVKEGFITAGMGDWHIFTLNIEVPDTIPPSSKIVIKLFTENADTGQLENIVTIPLVLTQ